MTSDAAPFYRPKATPFYVPTVGTSGLVTVTPGFSYGKPKV